MSIGVAMGWSGSMEHVPSIERHRRHVAAAADVALARHLHYSIDAAEIVATEADTSIDVYEK